MNAFWTMVFSPSSIPYAAAAAVFGIVLKLYWPSIAERWKPIADRHVGLAPKPPAPTAMPLSRVAITPRPPPPFYAYTSDEFEGLRWRWEWRRGVDKVHLDFIEHLAAHCVTCGLRLVKNEWTSLEDSQLARHAYVTVFTCRFICDECPKGIDFQGSISAVEGKVQRLIERRALEIMEGERS